MPSPILRSRLQSAGRVCFGELGVCVSCMLLPFRKLVVGTDRRLAGNDQNLVIGAMRFWPDAELPAVFASQDAFYGLRHPRYPQVRRGVRQSRKSLVKIFAKIGPRRESVLIH
ncbi:hypothetical protein ATO6_13555 [Oceanicola sp. 22II-s10i]|nr:hypothetical protein ATO6_13555 [Oceanicola sp. 22II-s10i]